MHVSAAVYTQARMMGKQPAGHTTTAQTAVAHTGNKINNKEGGKVIEPKDLDARIKAFLARKGVL